MSRLEELIQKLCPDGVEYVPLSQICIRQKGTSITAADMKELNKPAAKIRIFAAGNTVADVDYGDIPDQDIITKPSIIVKSRGNIGFEYYEKPFSHKNEMWSYSKKHKQICLKFYYYYLLNHITEFQQKARSGKLPQISTPDTDGFLVPLPPLPVQEEIVRILDKFTALEAELEAELEARKKQYEYYSGCIFYFYDTPEFCWMNFKECCRISRGNYITKKDTHAGNIPVILGGQEPAYYINKSNHCGQAIVISRSGASAGFVSYWNEPIFVTDGFIIEAKQNTNIKFLYFFFKSIQDLLNASKRGAGIPHITSEIILSIRVPVPTLAEQTRIVSILDRFDALVNDITQGLPAELAARRRQYEYYRDKLLTFKEKAS